MFETSAICVVPATAVPIRISQHQNEPFCINSSHAYKSMAASPIIVGSPPRVHQLKLSVLILLATLLFSHGSLNAEPVDIANTINTDESPITIVRYINRGELDNRNAYKFGLIHLALDATVAEFGPYGIEPYKVEPDPKRQVLLIKEGVELNVLWASPGSVNAKAEVIPIQIDILRGLLGYRICLKNTASTADYSAIKTIDDLKTLKIAQGASWSDLDIYHYNGISPLQAPTFEGLVGMLAMNRFDCLPLGVDEITFIYNDSKRKFPPLSIDDNFILHYNFPLFLYVSKKEPTLARRIKKGLEIVEKNGQFTQLFVKYFADDLAGLGLSKRTLICLQSPYLKRADTCQLDLPDEVFQMEKTRQATPNPSN